jgi:hypothetical protein
MKNQFYWTELRAVLTAGKWDVPFPSSSPSGATLSWSELLRKFNKHCPGSEDIIEIANRTQALALLLGADQRNVQSEPLGSLSLGNECVLSQERVEEADDSYKTLKKLKSSNFDVLSLHASTSFSDVSAIDVELHNGLLRLCPRPSCQVSFLPCQNT